MLTLHPSSPTFADVEAAARRLSGLVVRTPLVESRVLNERLGGRLLVKAENLQTCGSFKIRGATNALALIPEADRARGVVAFSSGNHAQGVAYAARRHGVPATIVVPSDAPMNKIAAARADGATIITYDRVNESREAIGAKLAAETGASLVKPFDDPGVIAGQGTVGLEVLEQAEAMGAGLIDTLVCCASGGGLMAGITLAFQARSPGTAPIAAEPATHDDLARSLATGSLQRNEPGIRSICDALMTETPGEITTPILSAAGATGVAVTDDEVLDAMAAAFQHLKLVIEPGGAAALAAILSGKVDVAGRTVVAIASGGNVDAAMFRRALDRL